MKHYMSFIKKLMVNGGIFTLVVLFTYKFVFSKMDFTDLKGAFYSLDLRYIFCGVLAVIVMLCSESLTMKCYLHMLGENKSILQCGVYALTGNFFSAITPAATGGQPMQLYYMHKNNIPASKGALAILMDLCAYQFIIVTLASIGYALYFHTINQYLGSFLPVLWLGLAINSLLLFLTLTAIFSDSFVFKLTSVISKIIGFFSKNKEHIFLGKMQTSVAQYKLSASILKKNKRLYLYTTIITLLRIVSMHSVPFWIYKSFGLSGSNFLFLLALQSALYITFAALPLPGGVGIGERGFLLYFSGAFGLASVGPAMLLSRGIGFYLVVAISGISLGVITLSTKVYQLKQKQVCKATVYQVSK